VAGRELKDLTNSSHAAAESHLRCGKNKRLTGQAPSPFASVLVRCVTLNWHPTRAHPGLRGART